MLMRPKEYKLIWLLGYRSLEARLTIQSTASCINIYNSLSAHPYKALFGCMYIHFNQHMWIEMNTYASKQGLKEFKEI